MLHFFLRISTAPLTRLDTVVQAGPVIGTKEKLRTSAQADHSVSMVCGTYAHLADLAQQWAVIGPTAMAYAKAGFIAHGEAPRQRSFNAVRLTLSALQAVVHHSPYQKAFSQMKTDHRHRKAAKQFAHVDTFALAGSGTPVQEGVLGHSKGWHHRCALALAVLGTIALTKQP